MKRWGVPLLYGLAVLLALHAWRIKSGIDLQVYLRAGARVLEGEDLYVATESSPFKYAPPAAVFFAPLSRLPVRVSQVGWLVVSALAYIRFVHQSALWRGLDRWWQPMVVAFVASPYLSQVLFLGQMDAVLVLLMLGSELDSERRPLRSGMLWALVVAFKLPFLLFLAPALLFREWKRLGALVIGLLLVGLVGVLAFGFGGLVRELSAWSALLESSTPVSLIAIDNQSLTAIASSLGCHSWAVVAGFGAILLAAGARTSDRSSFSAIVFFLTAFLSPLGWLSNLVVVAPMASGLLAAVRERVAARIGLLALSIAAFINYDLLGPARFEQALRLKLFGWLTLAAAICFLRVSTSRTSTSPRPAPR